MNLYKAPIVNDYPLTPEKMLFMPTNQADLSFQQYSPQQLEQARLGRYGTEAKQYADRLSQDNMTTIPGITPKVQAANPVNPWGPELNKPWVAPEVAAPVVAPVAKTLPPIDPNSYLGGLIANSTPKPKYNQKSEDQLRNMAKAQKIGEFLGLLGDVYGTAKGAPIQRRESTSAAPYMQSILARQDKYQEQLSDFDKAEYLRKLQIGQAFDTKKAKDEADQWREKNFNADQEYKKYLLASKQADSAIAWQKFQKQMDQKDEDQKISLIRANKTGSAAADKANQPIKVQTAKQVYTLKPEEASYMRGLAINSAEIHKNHPEWFVPVQGKRGKVTYKLDPDVKDQDLIRGYLELQEGSEKPFQDNSLAPAIPATQKLNTGGLY